VRRDDGATTVCFTGTIGHQFDMETVLDAAAQLQSLPIRFVLCGTGDQLDRLRQRATGLSNCVWPGWRTRFEIWTLLRRASIGLAPYIRRRDFLATIPNKAAEYFSASLPVALSLDEGLLRGLLDEYDCGFSYAGDAAVLAEHVRRLHADRGALTRMAANARTLFDSRFRADIVYGEMIDALESIAGESRRR
jgi:glycosyltransferase involved in cell wall biosynthesis